MRSAEERFFAKVVESDECWEWIGAHYTNGYGNFYSHGTPAKRFTVPAHRWAWEFFNARIPDDLEVDHLCQNRSCVNPAHLELVSHVENMRRMRWAPDGTCRKSGHPASDVYADGSCGACRREQSRRYYREGLAA